MFWRRHGRIDGGLAAAWTERAVGHYPHSQLALDLTIIPLPDL